MAVLEGEYRPAPPFPFFCFLSEETDSGLLFFLAFFMLKLKEECS